MKTKTTLRRAFTLIELLVVATIIVILTIVAVLSYQTVQAKARDGQRESDLTKISLALENYKTDIKSYPIPVVSGNNDTTHLDSASTYLTALTTGNYISSIPADPTNSSPYIYKYRSDGTQYKLTAKAESLTTQSQAGDYYDPETAGNLQISSSTFALNNW